MTRDHLDIDGAQGEGGGQIVRSAMALALVTGRSVTIDRIRAGRRQPGLMRQHLTAVKAAAEICGGRLSGASVGSCALTFEPQPVCAGDYQFRVGTAGSATLVLQTVLPALLIAGGPSTLLIEGGTHNPWSPPFDFLQRAYLPLVERMGPRVTARLDRHGFYPAGGGRIAVNVQPVDELRGFDLLERGAIVGRTADVLLAHLPEHIARRELDVVNEQSGWRKDELHIQQVESAGPGNVIALQVQCEQVTEVFTGLGRMGVRAERVAGEAIEQLARWQAAGVPVGVYLADQLLLPLGIGAWQAARAGRIGGGGAFRTLPLTPHSTTQIEILRAFLGVETEVQSEADAGNCIVRVGRMPGAGAIPARGSADVSRVREG